MAATTASFVPGAQDEAFNDDIHDENSNDDTVQEFSMTTKTTQESTMTGSPSSTMVQESLLNVETPIDLPLGSILEIKLEYFCTTSTAESERLRRMATSCTEAGEQCVVRGRIQLAGGNSQRCSTNVFVRLDKAHCENQLCARLLDENGDSGTLRFDLSPNVVTDTLPLLVIEIRSRKTQKWKMSLSTAISFVLKMLSIGVEYELKFPLLDSEERACYFLCAKFRGGLQNHFQNCDLSWITRVHKTKAYLLNVKISDLQASESNSGVKCFAKIWSSATGKSRAHILFPQTWKNCGVASEQNETKAISLKINDADSEVIFVGIYRFSDLERNELIGLGNFCISPTMQDKERSESLSIQQSVLLYSETPSEKKVCGSAVFTLQITTTNEKELVSDVSLAATSLGGIAYPVRSGEMKCRFDVGIHKVVWLPDNVSEGDTITIYLRISQSNWKVELGPAKVLLDDNGATKYALIGDKAHAVVCWSPKDRAFPVLEICLHLQPQKKSSRTGVSSSVSITPNARVRRRQGATHTNEEQQPVLLATGSLNLCSFFSHLNVLVHTHLHLEGVKSFDSTDSERVLESMSVLAAIRASSHQQEEVKSTTAMSVLDSMPQPVLGDVCIHLLQGTGTILKKANCVSTYYVIISSGAQQVTSSCCSVDDAQALTWNQQLVLAVASSAPPLVYLTLYQRASGRDNAEISNFPSGDQVVGYLTFPIFPAALEEDHLLQLEVPFGMPIDTANAGLVKQNDVSYYQKRGMITLEVQYLPNQQPKTSSSESVEHFELVIHRVRGDLNDHSFNSGATKHFVMEIGLMMERGDKSEELAVSSTGVISLSASGITEVGQVIDLSYPTISTTLAYDSNCVIVGKIRDLSGNYCGRVHFPFRRDWRERLVSRKRQVWCPVCIEASNSDVTTTKNAVLMSLQLKRKLPAPPSNISGKFYVSVSEVIIDCTFGLENSSLLKLGKYGGANVELMYSSNDLSNETRYRTKQATNQEYSHQWRWKNEWFAFTHTDESRESQELQLSLSIGAQLSQPKFIGTLNLSSITDEAKLNRLNQWVALTNQLENGEENVMAHLQVVVCYIPTVIGEFCLEFSEGYTFSESVRVLHIEHKFYDCVLQETTCRSTVETHDHPEIDTEFQQLRLPYDSTLDTSNMVPEFIIRQVGLTKTLGEICLGTLSLDLSSISRLASKTSAIDSRKGFTWVEFGDKRDQTKTTGVAKLRVRFQHTTLFRPCQNSEIPKPLEKRVAAAEVFTIWKKFFYVLDQNRNGYIDRTEFTNTFMNHLDEMMETSDGQKLLQLLFGDHSNQDVTQNNKTAPSPQQISALFVLMDTNRDNEIEWAEYLRFLQQKQQQVVAATKQDERLHVVNQPEVASPQNEQKSEVRKKNREDCRVPQPVPADASSNQSDPAPEEVQDDNSRSLLKQTPSEPKRPSKTSSSEQKLLKLQYSNQEQRRLQQQISSLESILALERKRYAELAADRQALMRSYQQLHLKHQNELIQEQTKAKWMKQTIERQQQQLEKREALRHNQNHASIVLQSTVRSRLEQKRYQGLKLQRANAVIAIQCMTRRIIAKKKLRVLQEADRIATLRGRAASRLQRFTKFHIHRKERALLREARNLSATILQKNARRMIASGTWKRQKTAALKVQGWIRQRLAVRHVARTRYATSVVKTAVLGWFNRWQYEKKMKSTRKLQRWWRRASRDRSAFHEVLEAALCIQSAWKRRSARKWFEREWQRQEKFLSELEASICIQAAWRGRHQRRLSQSQQSTPRLDDESAVKALLYSIVATSEADAVDFVLSDLSREVPSVTTVCSVIGNNLTATSSADKELYVDLPHEAEFSPCGDDVDEEDDIKQVTADLVEAVIKLYGRDALDGGNSSFDQVDVDSIRGSINAECSSVSYEQPEQKNPVPDEVKLPSSIDNLAEHISNSLAECDAGELISSELDIIRAVLSIIQDQVVLLAKKEDNVSVQDLTRATGVSKHHDILNYSYQDESNEAEGTATTVKQDTIAEEDNKSSNNLQEVAGSGETPLPVEKERQHSTAYETPGPLDREESSLASVWQPSDTDAEVVTVASDEKPIDPREDSDAADSNAITNSEHPPDKFPDSIEEDDALHHALEDDRGSEKNDKPNDEQLPEAQPQCALPDATIPFDTEAAAADFMMPNDSESDDPESKSDREDDADGSSVDSADLMMEADEMAILPDTGSDNHFIVDSHRKTERLNSMTLLSDLDQLDAQSSKTP